MLPSSPEDALLKTSRYVSRLPCLLPMVTSEWNGFSSVSSAQTALLIRGAPGSLSYFSLEKLRADTVSYKMTDLKETLENRGTHRFTSASTTQQHRMCPTNILHVSYKVT